MQRFRIVLRITIEGTARNQTDKNMFALSVKEVLKCFVDSILSSWEKSHKLKITVEDVEEKVD